MKKRYTDEQIIKAIRIARFLNELREPRSLPKGIVCDKATEYTSKAMFFWSRESGVKLRFIQPGRPTQNAFVECLKGTFRKECLNQHLNQHRFRWLDEARWEIDQ